MIILPSKLLHTPKKPLIYEDQVIDHHISSRMPFSRQNSAKSGEMKPTRPPILKRHTIKGTFDKLQTTIRRVKTGFSDRASEESKSTSITSNPFAPEFRRRTQVSVSKPCTRASMKATLSGMTDGACDASCKQRSNNWYNLQRKLEGECNYRHGTCDWKNIPVFSDGDSVDTTRQALDIKQYWRSNPLRKRSSSSPNVQFQFESRTMLKRTQSHSCVEEVRKTKIDWKQLREPH
ncbi:hypothetical protein KVT40_007659 [Elsinoe batatas]|uniref:Uncharacterized protein n=1 Tax=Elsinoe batatas TaxID=2601811 RepID=A0A8K0KWG9_9PEZI|nr:hypothetical protein KVT40_007659 [Elsinoe batatas]